MHEKEWSSKVAIQTLLETLEQLNSNKELELVFDYVRLRFDIREVKHAIEDSAFCSYIVKYVFSHIQVMISLKETIAFILCGRRL